MIVSFTIGAVLQSLNPENANPNAHETIFLTITIVAASSGILLWGMCMWDCLGNKEIKSPTLVFGSLILFNWIASIVYYFRFIFGRSKREKFKHRSKSE